MQPGSRIIDSLVIGKAETGSGGEGFFPALDENQAAAVGGVKDNIVNGAGRIGGFVFMQMPAQAVAGGGDQAQRFFSFQKIKRARGAFKACPKGGLAGGSGKRQSEGKPRLSEKRFSRKQRAERSGP